MGRKSVRLLAVLDTGAAHCIFEREYGEQLGLTLEGGQLETFRTATGTFHAYGHEVSIKSFEWEFQSVVFFPVALEFHRNVLGRQGWLEQFRVAVVDYDSILHLSHYNQ